MVLQRLGLGLDGRVAHGGGHPAWRDHDVLLEHDLPRAVAVVEGRVSGGHPERAEQCEEEGEQRGGDRGPLNAHCAGVHHDRCQSAGRPAKR